jgi:MYXO-CTERM domain-containing protein
MFPIVSHLLLAPALAGVQVNGAGTVYTTIGQALAAAASGDTLHVEPGSYTESVVIDKDLTLRGPDIGIATWNGGAGREIIQLDPGIVLTLEKLKLRGSGSDQRVLTAEGDNTLVLDEVDLESDSASDGGVLHVLEPASLTLLRSVLQGTSGGDGGVVYAYSSAAFPFLVEDSTFDGVADGSGGSLWLQYAELTCTRCTFEGSAGMAGGAIDTLFADLVVSHSLFCHTEALAGGAVYSNADVTIHNSRFVETAASSSGGALQALSGTWTIENNHFLGVAVPSSSGVLALYSSQTATVRNNLFFEHEGYAVHRVNGTHTTRYNWFESSVGSTANYSLDATNERYSPGDPLLVSWTRDGDCGNDQLWPTPLLSPLLNEGDLTLLDPDGSVSDIGAYGGPDADPTFFSDGDADGGIFFSDCDDADPLRSEGLDELCDNLDNDCDGVVDEEAIDMLHFYEDCDEDGQGNPDAERVQCSWPTLPECGGRYVCLECVGEEARQDCDDTDPTIHAGADELCDPEDRDCDGSPTEGAVDAELYFQDEDGDGYGGAALFTCDGKPEGVVETEGDCADLDPAIHPGQPELCNGLDDDCNGVLDDADPEIPWYPDTDGDGYGDQDLPVMSSCSPGAGWLELGSDCDDTDALVNPDQPEICNGTDDDCNGLRDEGQTLEACAPDPERVALPGDCAECRAGCGCQAAPVSPGLAVLLGLVAIFRRGAQR